MRHSSRHRQRLRLAIRAKGVAPGKKRLAAAEQRLQQKRDEQLAVDPRDCSCIFVLAQVVEA